jgi:hypothetical protein
MGLLRRWFGRGDGDVPGWASFFDSADAYRTFCEVVAAELGRRGLEGEMADGMVKVVRQGEARSYGMQNLAQLCNGIERAEWAGAIESHFENAFQSEEQSLEIERKATDFEAVRDLIKVRIYPADHPGITGEQIIHRPLADDIVEVLTYDLPSAIATVQAAHAAGWQRPQDELFELGLRNVRAEGRLDREELPIEEGATVSALTGDSFFAATHALMLGDYLPSLGAHGALVAVPTRHLVLCHPIEDIRTVHATKAIINVARAMFDKGPGSISPSMYWWRSGRMQRLPALVKADQISLVPPDEFVDLLNGLARERPGS